MTAWLIGAAAFLAALTLRAVRGLWLVRRDATTLCAWDFEGSSFVVRDHDGWRELLADDSAQAMLHTRVCTADTLTSGLSYTDGFHLAVALAGVPERALFIGGGGCIGPRQFASFYTNARIEVVESDPRMIAAARRFFWLQETARLHVHAADGALFVGARARDPFDVVVLDAYAGTGQLPDQFSTVAFFQALRASLTPGGVLCANLVDGRSRRAAAALASSFGGDCRFFEVPPDPGLSRRQSNYIALAVRSPRRHAWQELATRAAALDPRVRRAATIARRPRGAT